MPRVVKEVQYSARRSEILDAAQRLIAIKGYEQMTIADILAELGISKGAFYHYFDSKSALLEALVEKMRDEAVRLLQPVFEDPGLAALEKIQRWFDTTARWKTDRKTYLLSLLRVWYHDDNAVVVQKLRADSLAWMCPLLGGVVHQGIREGVFDPSFPDHVGQVVFSLLYDLGDTLARMILSTGSNGDTFQNARSTAAAYTDALERALGAPPGSLRLVDTETLREWFVSPDAVA
jgi:AcrR family transcriptional regulator